MKPIYNKILGLLALSCLLFSCKDNFLDRYPTNDLNNGSFWNTENDLRVYNNGLYNLAGNNDSYMFLVGFTNTTFGSATHSVVAYDVQSDNFASVVTEHLSYAKVAAGQQVVPTAPGRGSWIWGFLRSCNVFMENYKKTAIATEIKNQYAGEVYFFRAWFYLDKVQNFGDVPYITSALETTSPELFGKRTPRKQVMDSVLRDIDKAIEYLPESWGAGAPDRANKYVALALKSRLCLYEGTYRKYHGLGDYEKYLNEAVKASSQIIAAKKYQIYNTGNPKSDYRSLFINKDLSTNPEMLMSRKYVEGLLSHNMSSVITSQNAGITKDFIDDFLCLDADGEARPVANSTSYKDNTIEEVFDHRDPRMSQIVLDPRDEFAVYKTNVGYPRLLGMGGFVSATGYHLLKYYSKEQELKQANNDSDAPLFRYAEVLLNYAEAKEELGQLSQGDLDVSINLLRARAGMPAMKLNPVMDPKYAGEGISSNLVEIRRERRVELSFEELRYQDLMRWKKGAYMAKKVLGMRFEAADRASARYKGVSDNVKTFAVAGKNYIDVFSNSDLGKRTFNEARDYLMPIPINVISKNQNIIQNPIW